MRVQINLFDNIYVLTRSTTLKLAWYESCIAFLLLYFRPANADLRTKNCWEFIRLSSQFYFYFISGAEISSLAAISWRSENVLTFALYLLFRAWIKFHSGISATVLIPSFMCHSYLACKYGMYVKKYAY